MRCIRRSYQKCVRAGDAPLGIVIVRNSLEMHPPHMCYCAEIGRCLKAKGRTDRRAEMVKQYRGVSKRNNIVFNLGEMSCFNQHNAVQ